MSKVAGILARRGHRAEAESLSREVLNARRRLFGDDDPATIGARFNLATNYDAQGRDAEAESIYRETLEIAYRRFGEAHQIVWVSMNNLSFICLQQGRYDEAESWARRLLEIHRRWRGAQSRQTLFSAMKLANVVALKGNYSEAEALYLDSLETAERNNHEEVEATARMGLAKLHLSRGERSRAEPYFRRASEYWERTGNAYGAYAMATFHALAGNHEAAILKTKEAIQRGYSRDLIAKDPDLALLAGNPEFETVLETTRN